jgi:hypothetical protein
MGSYMGTGQLGSALTHTVHTYTHAQLLERFVRTYPTEVLQYVALCLTMTIKMEARVGACGKNACVSITIIVCVRCVE